MNPVCNCFKASSFQKLLYCTVEAHARRHCWGVGSFVKAAKLSLRWPIKASAKPRPKMPAKNQVRACTWLVSGFSLGLKDLDTRKQEKQVQDLNVTNTTWPKSFFPWKNHEEEQKPHLHHSPWSHYSSFVAPQTWKTLHTRLLCHNLHLARYAQVLCKHCSPGIREKDVPRSPPATRVMVKRVDTSQLCALGQANSSFSDSKRCGDSQIFPDNFTGAGMTFTSSWSLRCFSDHKVGWIVEYKDFAIMAPGKVNVQYGGLSS